MIIQNKLIIYKDLLLLLYYIDAVNLFFLSSAFLLWKLIIADI